MVLQAVNFTGYRLIWRTLNMVSLNSPNLQGGTLQKEIFYSIPDLLSK